MGVTTYFRRELTKTKPQRHRGTEMIETTLLEAKLDPEFFNIYPFSVPLCLCGELVTVEIQDL